MARRLWVVEVLFPGCKKWTPTSFHHLSRAGARESMAEYRHWIARDSKLRVVRYAPAREASGE